MRLFGRTAFTRLSLAAVLWHHVAVLVAGGTNGSIRLGLWIMLLLVALELAFGALRRLLVGLWTGALMGLFIVIFTAIFHTQGSVRPFTIHGWGPTSEALYAGALNAISFMILVLTALSQTRNATGVITAVSSRRAPRLVLTMGICMAMIPGLMSRFASLFPLARRAVETGAVAIGADAIGAGPVGSTTTGTVAPDPMSTGAAASQSSDPRRGNPKRHAVMRRLVLLRALLYAMLAETMEDASSKAAALTIATADSGNSGGSDFGNAPSANSAADANNPYESAAPIRTGRFHDARNRRSWRLIVWSAAMLAVLLIHPWGMYSPVMFLVAFLIVTLPYLQEGGDLLWARLHA
ncbi:MAG: hypothetical protein SOI64_08060 [Bifidobacterium mongoliense]